MDFHFEKLGLIDPVDLTLSDFSMTWDMKNTG